MKINIKLFFANENLNKKLATNSDNYVKIEIIQNKKGTFLLKCKFCSLFLYLLPPPLQMIFFLNLSLPHILTFQISKELEIKFLRD